MGAHPSSAVLNGATLDKRPRIPKGTLPAWAWSWLRTLLVPGSVGEGEQEGGPQDSEAPCCGGREGGGWASRNLWSGLALAVASACRSSAGEGRWRLSYGGGSRYPERMRGLAWATQRGSRQARAVEKGASGDPCSGEVGVSVVGVGRVLWVTPGLGVT